MFKPGIFLIFVASCFCLLFIVPASADEECDETKCPGPLAYYRDLKCKPIYKNPGDCCAVKYDCSHLYQRSTKNCYVNNHVYEIGEKLKPEDSAPCDIGCTCVEGYPHGIASFSCVVVDCFQPPPKEGCYRNNSAIQCCPGDEICPEDPRERAICLVDGKEFKEGEYFDDKDNPSASCICNRGYQGENIEPFCYTPKRSYCSPEMKHSDEIHKKCAPVYYSTQSPQTSCSVFSRCQNKNDTLISHPETRNGTDSDKTNTCTFGNIVMQISDELNQATDYSSVCVKCKCEVPPIPTCQRLPDDECDVTHHPPFDSY